jgi:GNAT superfamily N-acetyltransferase
MPSSKAALDLLDTESQDISPEEFRLWELRLDALGYEYERTDSRSAELEKFIQDSDYEFFYMVDPVVPFGVHIMRRFWTAKECGVIRAWAEASLSLKTNSIEIIHLYVDPAHRRRGIASQIIDRVKLDASENARKCVYADATSDAVFLYTANGFGSAGVGAGGFPMFKWVPHRYRKCEAGHRDGVVTFQRCL